MATKRIIDLEQQATLSNGSWVMTDNTTNGTKRYDLNDLMQKTEADAIYDAIETLSTKNKRLLGNIPSTTATGKVVHATESYNSPPLKLTVNGSSVQDGTPTPSSPVAIDSVESVAAVLAEANLINTSASLLVNKGLSQSGTLGTDQTNRVSMNDSNYAAVEPNSTYVVTLASGWQFIGNTYTSAKANVGRINSNWQASGFTFTTGSSDAFVRLMFRKSDDTDITPQDVADARFAISVNASTTVTPIDLQGHELRSLPDGTHDELVVDADGNVTLVQRVGSVVFDGITYKATSGSAAFWVNLPAAGAPQSNASLIQPVLSDKLTAASINGISSGTYNGCALSAAGTSGYLRVPDQSFANVTAANTWLASNNVTMIYPLATPVIHDLGTVTLPAIPAPDAIVWASTVPATTISLTYEKDTNALHPSRSLRNILRGSGSGSVIAVHDAFAAKPLDLTVDGKSVQDGTPTPSSPVAIDSVESVALKVTGRNMLQNIGQSGTTNGITFTVNADGSVHASGTSTGASIVVARDVQLIGGVTYTLSGCPSGGGNNKWRLYFDGTTDHYDNGAGTTWTTAEGGDVGNIIARVYTEQTVDFTYYPMLNVGGTAAPFQPYADTTTPIDLQGHELRSLPDGTHDELTVDADGNATLVQRVGSVVFDGSNDESYTYQSNLYRFTTDDIKNYIVKPADNNTNYTNKMMSSHLTPRTFNQSYSTSSETNNGICGISTTGQLAFVLVGITTVSGLRTWLASNNITLTYPLATPVTHDLGNVALPELPAPDLTAWAETEPSTTIALDYERDVTIAINAIEEAIAELATS